MRYWVLMLGGIGACASALAQNVAPEAAFGARESVQEASLSPDGRRLAFIAPTEGQGSALFTVPVDGSAPPQRALLATGNPERLRECGWVSNSRMACTVY